MPELYTMRLVIAWTCVVVFVASATITLLALLRVIQLPSEKYLNRLFAVIIVAVVGTCAGFFQEFIHSGADTDEKKPISVEKPDTKPGPAPAAKPTPEPAPAPKPTPAPAQAGWIGFRHSGAYVAKFYMTWKEGGQSKSWSSGKKTAGYFGKILLKADAREIKITAQAATGLVWDPWGTIFKLELKGGPPNKVYVAKGTTLNRKWDTAGQ